MSVPANVIREWEVAHGVDRQGPIVTFYDHALPDNEATKKSGRPRFKHAVFVQMKTRNDPTGSTFCRKVEEKDKEQFPKQWEHYTKLKEAIESRLPSIKVIPGMDAVAFEELKALEITNCQQLAEYEGDLSPINHLREIAKRIMEIDYESGRIREGRENIPEDVERRSHGDQRRVDWSGFAGDPTGGSERDRGTAGRVPGDNEGRQSVQERPQGRKRLLRSPSVEVFHYELEP